MHLCVCVFFTPSVKCIICDLIFWILLIAPSVKWKPTICAPIYISEKKNFIFIFRFFPAPIFLLLLQAPFLVNLIITILHIFFFHFFPGGLSSWSERHTKGLGDIFYDIYLMIFNDMWGDSEADTFTGLMHFQLHDSFLALFLLDASVSDSPSSNLRFIHIAQNRMCKRCH